MVARKKTVKNSIVKPFALEDDVVWSRINYRHDPAESWRNVLASPLIVLPTGLHDARRDALHEFDIEVNVSALERAGLKPSSVSVAIIVRDNFSKKAVDIYNKQIAASPIHVSVPRSLLEETSLARRIDFEIMLVALDAGMLKCTNVRKSARLSKQVVTVSTENQGISFNFRRTTAEEFQGKGLPGATTFYVEFKDALDLYTACDDVSAVLSVLVHEDAWASLQEIRAGDRLGEALGTMLVAEVVLAVIANAKTLAIKPDQIEEGSVLDRIFNWLGSANEDAELVAAKLTEDEAMPFLQSIIQDALKLTKQLKRVRLGQEDDQ